MESEFIMYDYYFVFIIIIISSSSIIIIICIVSVCVTGEVSSLASRADLASIAERPDVMQRATALLECLRGAAQGTSPDAQQPLFSVCAGVMEPLLALQKAYRQHEPVVCLLLKLAGDVVEAHVSYLPVSASRSKNQRGVRHLRCSGYLPLESMFLSFTF